jgi:pimeloyl-ACP methyl ester carboxylesterase
MGTARSSAVAALAARRCSDVVIYLHGFASSSQSGKATYLGQKLRAKGVRFAAPDLNLPDFSTLTVTRMLEQTHALIANEQEPVTLIGSSLGAFAAVNASAKWPDKIASLVLLAPALDLRDLGGEQLQAWRESGHMTVFHFAYGRVMQVGYALYEDAQRFDTFNADVRMPILIFQGKQDTVVSPATVQAWSAVRPNVALHMLDDDHQLGASLDYMWKELQAFLQLPE